VEAFGMVALEAMVAGVPVVSGPVPGPQFVLGRVGYYYASDDPEAIARTLDEVRRDHGTGEGAERLARGADRALREFSIAALARHLDDLFFRTD
jgi:glycosyltransferase involved in cell wall biosynthesis